MPDRRGAAPRQPADQLIQSVLIWISARNLELLYDPSAMSASDLKRNVLTVVAIKIVIVVLAAIFVFGPDRRPRIDADTLDRQILNHPPLNNRESIR